jgi:ADP-ribosylglycohydrolase
VLHGTPIKQALVDALQFAGDKLRIPLEQALAIQTLDSVAVAEHFGSSCHLAEGLPVIFHIAKCAPDYQTAIKANIRAGGDNCGRSIMLGAFMAAYMVKQGGLTFPVPLEWLARYGKIVAAADACTKL